MADCNFYSNLGKVDSDSFKELADLLVFLSNHYMLYLRDDPSPVGIEILAVNDRTEVEDTVGEFECHEN